MKYCEPVSLDSVVLLCGGNLYSFPLAKFMETCVMELFWATLVHSSNEHNTSEVLYFKTRDFCSIA